MAERRVCEFCGQAYYNLWAHAEECSGALQELESELSDYGHEVASKNLRPDDEMQPFPRGGI